MKAAYDKFFIHWKRSGHEPPDYAVALRNPKMSRIVASWLPEDKSVPILDVGCGWGHLLLGLWASGFRNLTGVELARDQYEVARASLPRDIRVYHANANDFLNGRNERFSLVTVFDVIEHMSNEDGLDLLRLIFRALETPGSIVMRTGNMASLFASYMRHIDLTHEAGYTESSLFQLLDLAGFVDHKVIGPVTDLRYWRWYAPWRGFAFRERLVTSFHSFLYRAMAQHVGPTAFGQLITVQSFKK